MLLVLKSAIPAKTRLTRLRPKLWISSFLAEFIKPAGVFSTA